LSTLATSDWIAIATLLRPQGRRGELLAEPLTDLPEIFTSGREVALAKAGTQPPPNAATRTLLAHWLPIGKNAGRVVLEISGCTSINDAETLAGLQVYLPAQQLPILDADTYFVGDLIGCTLFESTADGDQPAGTITDIEFATAPDGRTRLPDAAPLLAITLPNAPPDAEPVLVPFVRAWLKSVDIPNRRITMHLPTGLLGSTTDNPKP
jgi:16S rRNA processing protein RimM